MAKASSSSTNAKIRLACYAALPVVLYLIPLRWVLQGHPLCLFRNLLGRPCWGCGMTRALFSLLHGDFAAAWEYNRMAVFAAPLLFCLYIQEVKKTIGEL